MSQIDTAAVLEDWREEKERWEIPETESYKISTCTVGVQLTPAVSFPLMAGWMLRNYTWEETKKGNQLMVHYGTGLKTVLLWNPYLFEDSGENTGEETPWHYAPSGHLAHKALPNYCYNSVSFLVELGEEKKVINVKYFVNGSMTLTGCRSMEDAKEAVRILREEMEAHQGDWFQEEHREVPFEIAKPFTYRMMNAYFSFGFSMDCLKVYHFCADALGLYTQYEPKDYQGVIVYYMWNKNQASAEGGEGHNGRCQCSRAQCALTGKRRRGNGEGDCIKMTFIIFSTGKVLITGGVSEEMIRDCYTYFTGQMREHAREIVQFSFQDFLRSRNLVEEKTRKKRGKKPGEKKAQKGKKRGDGAGAGADVVEERTDAALTQYWPQTQTH